MTNITADYFRNTKIKILSPAHFKQVQEAVFSVGGGWGHGKHIEVWEVDYLFIDDDLVMTWGDIEHSFCESERKEITFPPKEEENIMTEEWKPTAGEEVLVRVDNSGRKFRTHFVGYTSKGGGVFEVTKEMDGYEPEEVGGMDFYDAPLLHNFSPTPKTKLIHGVEVPDISFVPGENEWCYFPDPADPELFCEMYDKSPKRYPHRVGYGLCYPYTEEGKQAAILHAKAMLGIA